MAEVSDAALSPANAARLRRAVQKQPDDPAFVLHRYPWKETSFILDLLTRDHGRIAVVAKGAKRPHSTLRGTLVSFAPLQVAYSGKGEVKTLTRAEWLGGSAPLMGLPLMAAFYFNELLIKLLAREDAHPALFDAYARALALLAHGEGSIESTLRSFELTLLTEIGLMPPLDTEQATAQPVHPQLMYRIAPEGVSSAAGDAHGVLVVEGWALLAMHGQRWHEPGVLPRAKAVMRMLLAYHLGAGTLKTRQLLIDLHNL
jgi:DNA repair protein RecO (recombination protein O)